MEIIYSSLNNKLNEYNAMESLRRHISERNGIIPPPGPGPQVIPLPAGASQPYMERGRGPRIEENGPRITTIRDFEKLSQEQSFENVNFIDADFSGKEIDYKTFYYCNFNNTIFENSNLNVFNFIDSIFTDVNFRCNFKYVEFHRCTIKDTDFTDASFIQHTAGISKFKECSFENCKFNNANLNRFVFEKSEFNNVSFKNAVLTYVNFNSNIFNNNISFENSILTHANFYNSKFNIVNFNGADVNNSRFIYCRKQNNSGFTIDDLIGVLDIDKIVIYDRTYDYIKGHEIPPGYIPNLDNIVEEEVQRRTDRNPNIDDLDTSETEFCPICYYPFDNENDIITHKDRITDKQIHPFHFTCIYRLCKNRECKCPYCEFYMTFALNEYKKKFIGNIDYLKNGKIVGGRKKKRGGKRKSTRKKIRKNKRKTIKK